MNSDNAILILDINNIWNAISSRISVLWPTPGQAFQWWLIRGNRKLHSVCLCVHMCIALHNVCVSVCSSARTKNRCSAAFSVLLSKHNTWHGHNYSYCLSLIRTITPGIVGFYKCLNFVAEKYYNMLKKKQKKTTTHKPGCCCWYQSDWSSLAQMSLGWVILHPWCPQTSVYPGSKVKSGL